MQEKYAQELLFKMSRNNLKLGGNVINIITEDTNPKTKMNKAKENWLPYQTWLMYNHFFFVHILV
jgi:hypothetical protein